MARTADSIKELFRALDAEAHLKHMHHDRRFLSTLHFTRVQLHKYDSVVVGVNERLNRLLSQKQH